MKIKSSGSGEAARLFLSGLLSLVLLSCANQSQSVRLLDLPDVPSGDQVRSLGGSISEVAPPAIFLDLANLMDSEPEVAIALPNPTGYRRHQPQRQIYATRPLYI